MRIIIILPLLLFLSQITFSQSTDWHLATSFGVKKSFLITTLDTTDPPKRPFTLMGAMLFRKTLKKKLILETGMEYSSYKSTQPFLFQVNGKQYDQNIYYNHFLSIPIRLNFLFKSKGVFAQFGINNKFLMGIDSYFKNKNGDKFYLNSNYTGRRYIPSLDFGLGYNFDAKGSINPFILLRNSLDVLNLYKIGWFEQDHLIINSLSIQIGCDF